MIHQFDELGQIGIQGTKRPKGDIGVGMQGHLGSCKTQINME